MSPNYLPHALRLIWMVIGGSILLSFVPEFQIFGTNIRPIKPLSTLWKSRVVAENSSDTSLEVTNSPLLTTNRDSVCVAGITCIEDFSPKHTALQRFSSALTALETKHSSKVRIGFFGDSFVEGDILIAHLRDTLQQLFGGTGVGLMPITAAAAKIRPTITHQYSNWTVHSIRDKDKKTFPLGIMGETFIPQGTGTVAYSGAAYLPHLDRFKNVSFFYSHAKTPSYTYTADTATAKGVLKIGESISQAIIPQKNIKKINFKLANAHLYAMNFDDKTGIYIDNMAIRGNPGVELCKISPETYQQFDAFLKYNLIIVQYGLNVSNTALKDYDFYEKDMTNTIQHLQKAFPKSDILVLGVTDRSMKIEGEYLTYPKLPMLVAAQRKAAKNCGVAFWDVMQAMGGKNSMVKWVDKGLANKDYTHFNFKGGQKIGRMFAQSLLYEKKRYK